MECRAMKRVREELGLINTQLIRPRPGPTTQITMIWLNA
jgi:hypothetical protein